MFNINASCKLKKKQIYFINKQKKYKNKLQF